MKVSEILNENDLKLLESHKGILGNPDCNYLDELLLNHSLSLDIKEYALLRILDKFKDFVSILCEMEEL